MYFRCRLLRCLPLRWCRGKAEEGNPLELLHASAGALLGAGPVATQWHTGALLNSVGGRGGKRRV